MSSGTSVYALPFILTSQSFVKVKKIKMGKRKKCFETLPATLYLKYGYILKRQREEGNYKHY